MNSFNDIVKKQLLKGNIFPNYIPGYNGNIFEYFTSKTVFNYTKQIDIKKTRY